MDDLTLPAPDAPAEEWGRLAVSLPGWRWMPGMLASLGRARLRVTSAGGGELRGLRHGRVVWSDDGVVPDPDDPATAGCLLALLGSNMTVYDFGSYADEPGENGMRFRVVLYGNNKGKPLHWPPVDCSTLGRACIAAAAALGRWPGGTH